MATSARQRRKRERQGAVAQALAEREKETEQGHDDARRSTHHASCEDRHPRYGSPSGSGDVASNHAQQTYTREADRRFRYDAVVDGEPFTARLETDAFGRVVRYEGLWEAEGPAGDRDN